MSILCCASCFNQEIVEVGKEIAFGEVVVNVEVVESTDTPESFALRGTVGFQVLCEPLAGVKARISILGDDKHLSPLIAVRF